MRETPGIQLNLPSPSRRCPGDVNLPEYTELGVIMVAYLNIEILDCRDFGGQGGGSGPHAISPSPFLPLFLPLALFWVVCTSPPHGYGCHTAGGELDWDSVV